MVFGDPHFVGMVMEPDNGVGAVAHLKVATLANAFLSNRTCFGEVRDARPIHEDDRSGSALDRRKRDLAIVLRQDRNELF